MPDIAPADRAVVAFLIAPLAVPLYFFAAYMTTNATAIFLTMFIAYAGTAVFGIPIYLLLKWRRWTAFWIAPIVGFVLGGTLLYIFSVLLGFMLGERLSTILQNASDPKGLEYIVWPVGPLGAVVGSLLWIIGRPDRSTP